MLCTLFLLILYLNLLGSRSIYFIAIHSGMSLELLISREDVVKEIHCLYIFFDGAGILATQIQHIIINKIYTYISLVSPSPINSFSMGEFF